MNKKRHKTQKKYSSPDEFHGDMSKVPTSRREDGFRHMRTTPNQWGLSGWEHDVMFDGKSFEQITGENKKRQPPDREEISWIENSSRNLILGVSETRSYRIHCKAMTTPDAIGQRFYIWWESDMGWKTHEWGFITLTEALDYCRDKLAPTKQIVKSRFIEGDTRGIISDEMRILAKQLKENQLA